MRSNDARSELHSDKGSVIVRHVSDDRIAAAIDIVSPANKSHWNAVQTFLSNFGAAWG
jgi:hypothetical protein